MNRKILRRLGNPLTDRGVDPQCSINIPLIHIPLVECLCLLKIHYEVNAVTAA